MGTLKERNTHSIANAVTPVSLDNPIGRSHLLLRKYKNYYKNGYSNQGRSLTNYMKFFISFQATLELYRTSYFPEEYLAL